MRKIEIQTPLYNLGYLFFDRKYHECKNEEELNNFLLDLINLAEKQKNELLKQVAVQLLNYSNANEIQVLVERKEYSYKAKIDILNLTFEHSDVQFLAMKLNEFKEKKVNSLIKNREYDQAKILEKSVFKYEFR